MTRTGALATGNPARDFRPMTLSGGVHQAYLPPTTGYSYRVLHFSKSPDWIFLTEALSYSLGFRALGFEAGIFPCPLTTVEADHTSLPRDTRHPLSSGNQCGMVNII